MDAGWILKEALSGVVLTSDDDDRASDLDYNEEEEKAESSSGDLDESRKEFEVWKALQDKNSSGGKSTKSGTRPKEHAERARKNGKVERAERAAGGDRPNGKKKRKTQAAQQERM